MTTKKELMGKAEQLARRFRSGLTGQFIHFEPYIHGEQLALGLANLASYCDDSVRVKKELERLLQILAKEVPIS